MKRLVLIFLAVATIGGALPVAADPQDLLDFCRERGERCSLSVYALDEGWERHLNADRPHSLASVSKILLLLAYADAVADGVLSPDRIVPLDEWGRFATFDGGAMDRSWEGLGRPNEVRLDDLVRLMILESDNATPDWLLDRLPKKRLRKARNLFGFHDDPLAISGMFGLWFNGGGVGGQGDRVAESYGDLGAVGYRREVESLHQALARDPQAVRTNQLALCLLPPWESGSAPCARPTPETSSAAARRLVRDFFTRSTTRSYGEVLKGLLEGDLISGVAQETVVRHLEGWLDLESEFADDFARFGFKPGTLTVSGRSDVVTRAHYMEMAATGERFVVVVFLDGLSNLGTPNDDDAINDFVRDFVFDADFRTSVRGQLPETDDRPELLVSFKKVKRKGGAVVVKVRIQNSSPNPTAGGVDVRLALVDPDTGTEELLAIGSVRDLGAYQTRNVTLRGNPVGDPAGLLATVVVDSEGVYSEQSEENNVQWQRLP